MLVSWVIKWSKSWLTHQHTIKNFTHQAWAIWDLSNHDFFRIIPTPGGQQQVTLSLESFSTIPFQARDSDVKMPKLRQHGSYHALSMTLAPFGGHGISPTRIQARFLCVWRIFFRILPLMRHSGQACWSPNNWSSESCWMHIGLPQSSLRQEVDHVYPNTCRLSSSCGRFDHPQSQQGALVQNRGVP